MTATNADAPHAAGPTLSDLIQRLFDDHHARQEILAACRAEGRWLNSPTGVPPTPADTPTVAGTKTKGA